MRFCERGSGGGDLSQGAAGTRLERGRGTERALFRFVPFLLSAPSAPSSARSDALFSSFPRSAPYVPLAPLARLAPSAAFQGRDSDAIPCHPVGTRRRCNSFLCVRFLQPPNNSVLRTPRFRE